MLRTWRLPAACVLLGLFLQGPSRAPGGEPPESDAAIRRLIAELDAEAFKVRRRAELELIRLGEAALPAVVRAIDSPSAEVRYRARRIASEVRRKLLDAAFEKLAAVKEDAQIDLEEGMLLVAEIVDPLIDRRRTIERLDELADAARKKLGPGVDTAKADPQRVVEAIRQAVFVDAGFTGNSGDYDNPANSSLDRVLRTRRGLPILLSQVVVCVGRRLEAPLVGVAIPRRYMVKYDGLRAPQGWPKNDIILDPFGGGRVVTVDEIEDLIGGFGGFDPDTHLSPASRRETLARMLRNLLSDYRQAGRLEKAWQVQRYLDVVEGEEEP